MKEKFKYTVSWEGELANYRQDFDTIEEARVALHQFKRMNSKITVTKAE
jgi:hypothetical protein